MALWAGSIKVSSDLAKFSGPRHYGSDVFSLSRDLDAMTSPGPA